jgi:hypothetical protein
MTEWKAIVGCGNYRLSNKGEVLRVSDNFLMNVRAGGKIVLRNDESERQAFLIHRLLATHFLPHPENTFTVGFKDGDKNNYSLDNLEWCDKFKINVNHNKYEIRVYHYINNKRIQKDFGYKKEGIEKARERVNKYIEEQMNK